MWMVLFHGLSLNLSCGWSCKSEWFIVKQMFKKKHILEMLWNCSKSNLKNMFVQLDHLPRDRDENSKNIYLKLPPRFKLSASEFHFPKSHNALRLSSFREVVLRTSCIRILRPWHQLQNVAKSINPEASIWWSAPVQKAQFHQPNHAWVFWFFYHLWRFCWTLWRFLVRFFWAQSLASPKSLTKHNRLQQQSDNVIYLVVSTYLKNIICIVKLDLFLKKMWR